uniref:Uncharacterized protein n=1 Tax=Kalanchoe fedtschenkoi TaxID=63787 RepID=A0A7N0TGN2_KALFE
MKEEGVIAAEPMNGGGGAYSYKNNSYYQRTGSGVVKEMIDEAILEKLDVNKLTCGGSNAFNIVDMGSSVGPNTFIAMQNLVEAVSRKYQAETPSTKHLLEFKVHFNDRCTNDFNTLFASLPLKRKYFAMGVPGTFHGRLFPKLSLHLAYTSYALQWLSRSPDRCLDKNSPAWNKGRIHYARAAKGVQDAYAAQLGEDMDVFLGARAEELVPGGMMVLIIPGVPDKIPPSRLPNSLIYELMGSVLVDMAKRGVISEHQVDSFNLPLYTISPGDIEAAMERNQCFDIERLEMMSTVKAIGRPMDWQSITKHIRAGLETIISKHFGSHIIDELFELLCEKTGDNFEALEATYMDKNQLLVILKRK